MGQPVVHFEVVAKDAEGSENLGKFYSEMFDWELHRSDDIPIDYATIDRQENLAADGAGIGGGIGGGMPGYGGHLTFYVMVDDVEATMAKAEELGGERVMGPDEVPGTPMVIGQIRDTDGNLVGVMNPGM